MTNKESIQQESHKPETEIILRELRATLERIGRLEATLCRLASFADEDATEVIMVTQLALGKFRDEITQVFATRYMHKRALQTWENEGGRVVYASV